MPTSQLQTSQHFEWDTPWSTGYLTVAAVVFVVWIIWQLVRERRLAQTRWWMLSLFLLLRLSVASVLMWMLLGPTSVLTHTETTPRTLAVYVDTSTSMQIQDLPDPASDRRWKLAAEHKNHPLLAADRAGMFAATLRHQTKRLIDAIDLQATSEERQEMAMNWQHAAGKCREWLESDLLKQAVPAAIQPLYHELTQTLTSELIAALAESGWITGIDPGDRDRRLVQLSETVDQFATRCRVFTDAMVHDSAGSTSTVPAGELPSRQDRVTPALRQGLTEWLKAGKNRFRIQLSQFAEHVTHVSLDDWEKRLDADESFPAGSTGVRKTDLSNLLKQIRDGAGNDDIAAAVVLTDGRHTLESPDDPRDLAAQVRLPLFLVPIGHGEMKRDLILHHVHAPTSVIQSDKILIEGIVTAHRCPGESSEVRLVEGNKVIETKRVQFGAEQDDKRFRFEIPTDKIERREFTIAVERLDGENAFENNTQAVAVDVTDAVLRLLLADGQARWEYQYLVNLFNRQDKIELDQLQFVPQVIGTGRRKKSRQFPQTVQEWSEYRVVVLGDVSPRQLTQQSQEALRSYVTQRGGSLIVIAGKNDMPHSYENEPLEQILPVEATQTFSPDSLGYRAELTAEGRTLDAMLLKDDLPATEQIWLETSTSLPIYFLSSYHKPKPTAQVLLNAISARGVSGQSPALLCWQTVGAGRVAYLSSPMTYQLRNRDGDKYHHRFWGQLVRWIVSRAAMTGSKTVKILADKSNYSQDDVAQVSLELMNLDGKPVSNAAPQVDIIQEGSVVSNMDMTADSKVPGRYLGTFAAGETGKYTLRARGNDIQQLLESEKYFDPVQIQIDFEQGLNRELSDPRSDRPLLQHLAEQTGGLVIEPTALAELIHAVSLDPRIQTSSQKTPLWDRWWCLWAILGCLTLEWIVRKRVGLA